MASILNLITLNTVIAFLFFLSVIWLIICVVRRNRAFIFRALAVSLILLFVLIFLQQNPSTRFSFRDLKDHLFPEKILELKYEVKEGKTGGTEYTRYVFKDPKPKIKLKHEIGTDYFHMPNVSSLNKVLNRLDLPPLKSGTKELASITNSKYDINIYRWKDYAKGILFVERTLCQDKSSFTRYHCLATITIRERY